MAGSRLSGLAGSVTGDALQTVIPRKDMMMERAVLPTFVLIVHIEMNWNGLFDLRIRMLFNRNLMSIQLDLFNT